MIRLSLALVLATSGLVAQSNSTIATTGQELTVTLSGVPSTVGGLGSVLATCSAQLGAPTTVPVNVIFVFDCSGSMGFDDLSGTGIPDFNSDGSIDRIDAAGLGFQALLGSIGGSNVDLAIVPFGSTAANADMGPAPGVQLFTVPGTDANMNGTDDILDVLASHDVGGASLFTPVGFVTGTNFDNALAAVNTAIAAQPAGEPTFVFFLTDGQGALTQGPGTPLATTIASGATVTTIGIGPGVAAACDPGGALDVISSQTGGICIFEPNPANLSTSLPTTNSTEIVQLALCVNGGLVAEQNGTFGLSITAPAEEILPLLGPGTNIVECKASCADGTATSVQATVTLASLICIDFETEDDFATPLVNGQDVSSPDEFGVLFDVTSAGMNLGAAIFDSSLAGPNVGSADSDLLVDSGNVLVLQSPTLPAQSVAGVFDTPNDSFFGGTVSFSFPTPVAPASIDMIDIDDYPGEQSSVVLTDAAGNTRTYDVPPQFTGDRTVAATSGVRTLNLATLAPQPGFASTATAIQPGAFDETAVVRIDVNIGQSGAIDNLKFEGTTDASVTKDADACLPPSGAGPAANAAVDLVVVELPTIGGSFRLDFADSGGTVNLCAYCLGYPTGIAAPELELAAFGSPDCFLRTDILSGLPHAVRVAAPGTAVTMADLTGPGASLLVGLQLCVQGLGFAPNRVIPTDRYLVTFDD